MRSDPNSPADRNRRAATNSTPDTTRDDCPNGLLKFIDNGISRSDSTYTVKYQLLSDTQTLAGGSARTLNYDYDADGRFTTVANANGLTEDQGYDDDLTLQEENIYRWDGDNRVLSVVPTTPQIGDQALHYTYDDNGNMTEVTDATGAIAASYRYDAFGNLRNVPTGYGAENRYRYSTKPLDDQVSDAPLYYYGYRYYDPVTGRWPSRDPIGERGGVNLYGFIGNGSVSAVDFLGLLGTGNKNDTPLPILPPFDPNGPVAPPEIPPGLLPPLPEDPDEPFGPLPPFDEFPEEIEPEPEPLPPVPVPLPFPFPPTGFDPDLPYDPNDPDLDPDYKPVPCLGTLVGGGDRNLCEYEGFCQPENAPAYPSQRETPKPEDECCPKILIWLE